MKLKNLIDKFTQIPNDLLEAKSISLKAKGLFGYMCSKPPNWNFTIRSMATQLKEGPAAIRISLQELRDFGWLTYERSRLGGGVYTLHGSTTPINKPLCEKPLVDNPTVRKSTRISNKDSYSNKDQQQEELESVVPTWPQLLERFRDCYVDGKGWSLGSSTRFLELSTARQLICIEKASVSIPLYSGSILTTIEDMSDERVEELTRESLNKADSKVWS